MPRVRPDRVAASGARASAALAWAAALAACAGPPPPTDELDLGPECAGTLVGEACLTLKFVATNSVRERAPGDVQGPLHWSVYQGGDVGLLGPGDNPELYGDRGDLPLVDLHPEGAFHEIHLPQIDSRTYQVLGYLDDNDSGKADSGDPVTFPKDPFRPPPDRHSRVTIELDYIR